MKKKILITGLSRGFGHFLALSFISDGYVVAGIDNVSPKNLDIELSGKLAYYQQIDLSDTAKLKEDFTVCLDAFYPDILINNAGMKTFQLFSALEYEAISDTIKVNFLSPVLLTKIWLSKAAKEAKLTNVLISSNAAYHGYSKGTVYCSTKSGLRVFAEALEMENTNGRLAVITLCPESFSSENSGVSTRISMQDVYNRILRAIRNGKSQEIPLISFRYKLKYLLADIRKYIKWFLG